ncbi:hypothetical protein [Streptomyces microflavus]
MQQEMISHIVDTEGGANTDGVDAERGQGTGLGGADAAQLPPITFLVAPQ